MPLPLVSEGASRLTDRLFRVGSIDRSGLGSGGSRAAALQRIGRSPADSNPVAVPALMGRNAISKSALCRGIGSARSVSRPDCKPFPVTAIAGTVRDEVVQFSIRIRRVAAPPRVMEPNSTPELPRICGPLVDSTCHVSRGSTTAVSSTETPCEYNAAL